LCLQKSENFNGAVLVWYLHCVFYHNDLIMKRLLLIAVIALISISSKGQNKGIQLDTIPLINGIYQYQEIVYVDSTLKSDQLYKNAKVYFVDVFNSARNVIQYDDKDECRIIGQGSFSECEYKTAFAGVVYLKWDIYYNTEIICKDGKYRFRFYDIVITQNSRIAQYNYASVHLTAKEAYDAAYKQKGPYKTLYPKVINKMIAGFKTNMITLKEYMIKKQPGYSASF
jgi:hypothetical protein